MLKKTLLVVCLLFLATTMAAAKDMRAVKLKKFLDRYPWSPVSYTHLTLPTNREV